MDIYIQSAGTSPDFDYSWQPQVPPLLNRVSDLIQSESPSLVLAKFGDQFFLLITGLESPTKKDFAGRVIRHSIAWITEANDNGERLTRAISSQYLQGALSINEIDRLIQLGGKNGFDFNSSKFKEFSLSILNDTEIENSSLESSVDDSKTKSKMAENLQALREELAFDLQNFRLPKNYEVFVVVTGMKSEDSLTQERIWRSLSNLVKSRNWKPSSNTKKGDSSPKKLMLALSLILLILIIGVVIFLIFLK